jgi:putative FmdB family regulatory protein
MPFYEYQCHACGHELEALQKMSDDALLHCPECNGETLKKKISVAGFQLKGTGWYETDFKNSGSAPKSDDNKSANADSKQSDKSAGPGNTSKKKSSGSTRSEAA